MRVWMDQRKSMERDTDVVDGRLISGREPEPDEERGKNRHRSEKMCEKNDRENGCESVKHEVKKARKTNNHKTKGDVESVKMKTVRVSACGMMCRGLNGRRRELRS